MDQRTKPYTLKETSSATGVSYAHLRRLCLAGKLPHTRLGKKYLIPSRIVDALLNGEGAW